MFKIVRLTDPELRQLIDAVDGIAVNNGVDHSTRSIALGKLMRALASIRNADLEAPLPDAALERVQQWRMTRTVEAEPALLLSPEEQSQQHERRTTTRATSLNSKAGPSDGKILSERLAGPDDPIYSEPARNYSPHALRALLRSKKAADISMTEPELFRRCRQALGLSQADIAEALLVASDRTVRRWEAGAIPIPGSAWVALRYMLGDRGLSVDDVETIIARRRAST